MGMIHTITSQTTSLHLLHTTMVIVLVMTLAFTATTTLHAFAQSDELDMTMDVSDEDKYFVLAGFAIAVAAVFLFLARDIILGRKTSYDKEDLASKRDKTFEKYHSDWGEDYEDMGSRKRGFVLDEELFENAISESKSDGDVPNYYDVLGVSRDAAQNVIKERFRELVKKTHPDKTGDDSEDELIKINKAYRILSNPNIRRRYDKYLGIT